MSSIISGSLFGRPLHRASIAVPVFFGVSLLLAGCSPTSSADANPPDSTVMAIPVVDVTQATSEGSHEESVPATSPRHEQAADIVGRMDIRQLCASVIMPNGDSEEILPALTATSDDDVHRISQEGWFGLMLSTGNIENPDQLRALNESLHEAGRQSASGVPMAVAVDEEGGYVRRVSGRADMGLDAEPQAMVMAEGEDEGVAYESGRRIGSYLADLGFDIDFAPVVDVRTDACDETMVTRCLSDDPATVSRLALAQVRGFSDTGIATTLKHFPGLGPTYGDSHEGSITSDKTLEELMSSDLVPYVDANREGLASMVMVGHVLTPNLTDDGLPASVSPQAMRVLKEEIGFDGLVITDSLGMGAALEAYPEDELAWRAIAAGADVTLLPVNPWASVDRMVDAVSRGDLPEERLREAATKAMEMRLALSENVAIPW